MCKHEPGKAAAPGSAWRRGPTCDSGVHAQVLARAQAERQDRRWRLARPHEVLCPVLHQLLHSPPSAFACCTWLPSTSCMQYHELCECTAGTSIPSRTQYSVRHPLCKGRKYAVCTSMRTPLKKPCSGTRSRPVGQHLQLNQHLLHLGHRARAVHQLADLRVRELVGSDERQQRDGFARPRRHLRAHRRALNRVVTATTQDRASTV